MWDGSNSSETSPQLSSTRLPQNASLPAGTLGPPPPPPESHHGTQLQIDWYPVGTRVDVWWCDEQRWFAAEVIATCLKTQRVKGIAEQVRSITCRYDEDQQVHTHSLHNNIFRAATGARRVLNYLISLNFDFILTGWIFLNFQSILNFTI